MEKHCDVWVEEFSITFTCECGAVIEETISDIDETISCPNCDRQWEVLEPCDLGDYQSGRVELVGEEGDNEE